MRNDAASTPVADEPARGWRAVFPPAQWLPCVPARLARARRSRRHHARGLRESRCRSPTPRSRACRRSTGSTATWSAGCAMRCSARRASSPSAPRRRSRCSSARRSPAWPRAIRRAGSQIAALTALLFAGICLLAWLLRLSSLVSFISETILVGFKAGAALTIAMTQLPEAVRRARRRRAFFERAVDARQPARRREPAVLAFGLLRRIALLVAGDKLLPGRPVALLVVVASIVVLMSVTPLADDGIQDRRRLPPGCPSCSFRRCGRASRRRRPARVRVLPARLHRKRVGGARARAASTATRSTRGRSSSRLGAANLAAAVGQGYPGRGRPVAVDGQRQGRRENAALAGIRLGNHRLCLLFLTGLAAQPARRRPRRDRARGGEGPGRYPRAAPHLGAEPDGVRGSDGGIRRRAAARDPQGRAAGGDRVACCCSSAAPRNRTWRVLGRVPGTHRYSDVARNPDNEAVPGVLDPPRRGRRCSTSTPATCATKCAAWSQRAATASAWSSGICRLRRTSTSPGHA